MAKTLKDILNGVKASKVVPGSTGKDPGVDYAPKAPNEQEFVKLHKTEKHSDRVGNTDELYQATNIKHSQVAEPKHGYKKPEDKNVNEAKKVGDEVDVSPSKNNPDLKSKATVKFVGKGYSVAKDKSGKQYTIKHEANETAKCNMTAEGTACPVHEMADCSSASKKTLKEVLTKKTSAGEIIKDFRKSKDTKFAGKSGEERQRMALGAYYSMHPEKSKKTNEEVEPINEVNHREYGAKGKMHPDMAKGMDVGMHTDFYQHGTGDKGYGMVTKNDGKTVHVRSKARTGTLGKTHKFTVTPHLGEETEGFNSGALHGVGSAEIVEATDLHPDYKLVKTGKKSTTAHPDGKPTYDLHYKGEKLTSIHPYSAYKDKKTPGSRVVASRKDITKYSASLPGRKTSELNDTTAAHVANSVIRHHQASIKEDLAVPLLGGSDGDESAEMAKTQLRALANKALHLAMQLGDEQIIEPWVQAKIAVAKDHVSAVHDYMVYGDHSKDKDKEEDEQTAPYDGSIDMTGAPRNTYPDFSVDVNTGRNV